MIAREFVVDESESPLGLKPVSAQLGSARLEAVPFPFLSIQAIQCGCALPKLRKR
jgi:hypothetical protein